MQGRYLLTGHPRSSQALPPADIRARLVLHMSSQISGRLGDSGVSAAVSLSAWPGKGTGSPSCLLQLNAVGDPARNASDALTG